MNNIELIKASAGSGKTFELMNRLSASIGAGTQPEGLLATTFTVKAAAELQGRIRSKLLEEDKGELASRVFDGLIGTVNGVCGQLLSEYAIDAGLSPALDVLPENNAEAIFNAAVTAKMAEYGEELEPVAARLSLNPLKEKAFGKTQDWKNDVKTILDLARSNRLGQPELRTCAGQSCETLKKVFQGRSDLSLAALKTRVACSADFQAVGNDTKATVKAVQAFLRFSTWQGAAKLAAAKYNKTKDVDFPIELFDGLAEELLDSRQLQDDMCKMIRGVFACAAESLAAYESYKQNYGLIDFVDQECNVLELAEHNPHFGELLKTRLTQIMVDEFQDTSPVQLALFLKLNEFSRNGSVWVGDPKQAIYGFRGTDPELMNAVAANLSKTGTLPNSWRSKENLVRLSNTIFKRTFSSMKSEEVVLGIPDKRKEAANGGDIEAWHLYGTNAALRMKSLAHGIADLIRSQNIKPCDIAVLFRSNAECATLTTELAALNISASAPSGELLATPECQLVMAAYRYSIDKHDTVALATLLALYGETPDWLRLLQKAKGDFLQMDEDEQGGKDFLHSIRKMSLFQKLKSCDNATPIEILERVIAVLRLDENARNLSNPDRRMANLEELRRLCNAYMNEALVSRSAATPAGFAARLADLAAEQAPGFGVNTVNVLTYHKSKGLEWPVVILASLNSGGSASAFGIKTVQAEHFDVHNPLKDRKIHYWPWPFGDGGESAELKNRLAKNPIQKAAELRDEEEGNRLFYVGLTRAESTVIFAFGRKDTTKAERKDNPDIEEKLEHTWLDRLTDESMFHFPMDVGKSQWKLDGEMFNLSTKKFSPMDTILPLSSPAVFSDELPDYSAIVHLPARLAPSDQPDSSGTATLLCEWTGVLEKPKCKAGEYNLLGNAFHNYIAIHPKENQKALAARILENWGISGAISPMALATVADRLYNWIGNMWPDGKVSCEVPITLRNDEGQLLQGFIDMLIETPDGFVIIDHKTHPNPADAETYAASCAPQLHIYAEAVAKATGKSVLQTIIHLPSLSRCYKVK